MMTRRGLLTASALGLAAPLLDACGNSTGTNPTPTVTVQQVVTISQNAVATLIQEFNAIGPMLTPAQQATVAVIKTDLTQASNVLAPLSTTMAGNQALPSIQQAEQDFNAIVAAVAVTPLPPPYSIAVAALAISLPIIEGFVNTYVPAAAASLADASARKSVIAATDRAKAQAMAERWKQPR